MRNLSTAIVVSTLLLMAAGCKKSGFNAGPTPKAEVEINLPCTGVEFNTDKKFFRANGSATSMDRAAAKEISIARTKDELARLIDAKVQSARTDYLKSVNEGLRESVARIFERGSTETAKRQMQGSAVICEKLTQGGSGKYNYYVALELSAGELVNALAQSIEAELSNEVSKEEEAAIRLDRDKFFESFGFAN